ncbi:MAG TPA: hypothetical protein VFO60_00130 [Candidatus Dormibacteraeota bacterium]|nr:hypothetical protein [Candidatus Dormibacteraeota bacterium]
MSDRFGEAIELPWWVLVLGAPPAVTLVLAVLLPAPLSGRALDAVASAAMLWVLVRVALRVRSPSMQSVWISAAFAPWLVLVLMWAVEVHG